MRAVLLLSPATLEAVASAGPAAPDLVVLDPPGSAGRRTASVLDAMRARWPTIPLFARIRPLASGSLDDLAETMPARPDGVWLSDARGRADVERLGSHLAVAEAELGLPDRSTRIVASVESARGALGLPSLIEAGPRLAAIACDLSGLTRDIGCDAWPASRMPEPLRAVLAQAVVVAAACGIPAIEAGPTEVADLDAYAAEAAKARRDGFSAKLAADPDQLAVLKGLAGQPPFGRWMANFVSGVATK